MDFSIIIPAYNAEKFITRAVERITEQNYSSYEIIIVDDGSTDRTAEVCEALQSKYAQVRYLYQQNSGPNVARENGVKVSTGEYILFVDADDLMSNHALAQIREALTDDSIEVLQFGYQTVDVSLKPLCVFTVPAMEILGNQNCAEF